jgi:hypothetical protein
MTEIAAVDMNHQSFNSLLNTQILKENKMAKMASLHAEGLTDDDLETAEIAAILEEMFVD